VIEYGRLLAKLEFGDGGALSGARGSSLGGRSVGEAEALWLAAAESGHPDAAWAWLGLGRIREDRPDQKVAADADGARDVFEEAARCGHSESRAYALFKLGHAQHKVGKDQEAAVAFKVGATSKDPDWAPRCAFDLGRIYWDLNDDEEASFWWYQAAEAGHSRISAPAREALDDPNSIWRLR
jgi:TPR repeat protein